jgi:hypothetical protein
MLEALRQITDRRRPFALPNHPTTQPPNHRTT